MKQLYCPGTAVAICTDEQPWPHLAIIKQVHKPSSGPLKCDVLWLYRCPDLKKPHLDQSLLCPCTVELVYPDGTSKCMTDPGDLKEVFFSAHQDTIEYSTILHEVRVLFLPNNGSQLSADALHKLKLHPGFICRHLVDLKDWQLYPLRPAMLWSGNGLLLKGLLKASEQDLKAMLDTA